MPDPALRPIDLLPALAIGAATLLALAVVQVPPRRGHRALAVFPPWVSATQAFARAAAAPGWRPLGVRRTLFGPAVVLRPVGPHATLPPGVLLLTGARAGGCLAAPTAAQE